MCVYPAVAWRAEQSALPAAGCAPALLLAHDSPVSVQRRARFLRLIDSGERVAFALRRHLRCL
eukprot:3018784-Alexandrium_andersonii.AAC.1